MPEGFPGHNLVAEPLHKVRSVHEHTERQDDQELTAIISCKSQFEYVLMTFTATSRPQCSHFHTSAKPLLCNVTLVRSQQTGTFKALGRSAWRPHILYDDLRHFFWVDGK